MHYLVALGSLAVVTCSLLWLDHRRWIDRDPDMDAKCSAIDDYLNEGR